MKPKCHMARIAMTWADSGAESPRWVMRHVEHCDECRAELEALRAVGSLLREESDQACPVEWADVRAALPERRKTGLPLWRIAGAAAACIVLVVAGAIWMLNTPPPQDRQTPHPGMAREARPTPERPVVVPKSDPAPPTVRIAKAAPSGKSTSAKPTKSRAYRHHRRIPPFRLVVKRDPVPEPRATAPEPPSIVAVAPVEQVIGIVGVSLDMGDEHSYVIREVSTSPTGQAQFVEL